VARPLYSVQFVAGDLAGPLDIGQYDYGADQVAVIRQVVVQYDGTGATSSTAFIIGFSEAAVVQWNWPPGMVDTVEWQGHAVGAVGPDSVVCVMSGDVAATAIVLVSGFLLSVP
jgi:hypothetical protein